MSQKARERAQGEEGADVKNRELCTLRVTVQHSDPTREMIRQRIEMLERRNAESERIANAALLAGREMFANLTQAQTRCTELLQEKRVFAKAVEVACVLIVFPEEDVEDSCSNESVRRMQAECLRIARNEMVEGSHE